MDPTDQTLRYLAPSVGGRVFSSGNAFMVPRVRTVCQRITMTMPERAVG